MLPQLPQDTEEDNNLRKVASENFSMRFMKCLLAVVAFFLSIGTFARLTLMENDTDVPNGMFVASSMWYPDPNNQDYNQELEISVEFGFHKGYKRLIRYYYNDDNYERKVWSGRNSGDRKLRDYMSELYKRENETPYDGTLTYGSGGGPTQLEDLREWGTFYYKNCMTDDYNITIHKFNNLTVTSSICKACYDAGNDAFSYFWLSSAFVFLYILLQFVAPSFECYDQFKFSEAMQNGVLYDKRSVYYRSEATGRIRAKIRGVTTLLCVICLDVVCMSCLVLGYVNFQRCRDAVMSGRNIGTIQYYLHDSIGVEAVRAVMAFMGLNFLFDFVTVCMFLLQRVKNSHWTNKLSGVLHLQRL